MFQNGTCHLLDVLRVKVAFSTPSQFPTLVHQTCVIILASGDLPGHGLHSFANILVLAAILHFIGTRVTWPATSELLDQISSSLNAFLYGTGGGGGVSMYLEAKPGGDVGTGSGISCHSSKFDIYCW